MTLNPARLARFSDWVRTLPPRPLPRTVIPVPGEYCLDYAGRLADAGHLELADLAGALDDPAAVILDSGRRKQHRQERLAAAAGQTPAPAAQSPRSRSTPTSSGSPQAASGSTAPATVKRPSAPRPAGQARAIIEL